MQSPSRIEMKPLRPLWLSVPLCCALAVGCTVGPTYEKPDTEGPAQYKEAQGDWIVAKPADAAPKGKWWQAFQDPILDSLIEQVQVSNQDLRAAEARYREAR